ncbi:MAG: enterochelin esterase-like enzyme [Porticoccaceae bacterium]|jgi:enterochelin esterase-like enzyme
MKIPHSTPSNAEGSSHPVVTQLLSNVLNEESLRQFLADNEFPLMEPGAVTFAWTGHADSICLLRWIHGGVDRTDFSRIPDTPLWLLRLAVQDNGRFEYKLCTLNSGHEEWILDPLNRSRAGDPFGDNSVCKTFGYERPEWTREQNSAEGQIKPLSVNSGVFQETRNEQVYLPAEYDAQMHTNKAYPLVVIHDGADFVTYADLQVSLDNLIASGAIPAIIVALVQTRDRLGEYSRGRRHARYLINDLLPTLQQHYHLSERAEDRVLLGASLGAVASLATVFRYPGVFGGVVLHSGSFILDERKLRGRSHPVFQRVARLVSAFKRAPNMPEIRAFVSSGELEGLASESAALAELLKQNGVSVQFKSAWDGHHWHNWRNQLRDGLVWVLNRNEEKKDD